MLKPIVWKQNLFLGQYELNNNFPRPIFIRWSPLEGTDADAEADHGAMPRESYAFVGLMLPKHMQQGLFGCSLD